MPQEYMSTMGHFNTDGTKYVITASHTPHEWNQYIQNREHLACVDVHGSGQSLYKRADGTRTQLSLHPDWPRKIYLRDQETGEFASLPGGEHTKFTLTPGLAEYADEALGITIRWTLFCPEGLKGEAWQVQLINGSRQPRHLLLIGEFPLTPHGYSTSFGYDGSFSISSDDELAGVFFCNHDPDRPDGLFNAFFCQSAPLHSFDTSTDTFLGSGNWNQPDALSASQLSNRLNCSMSCHAGKLAALASEHLLQPGQRSTVGFIVGVGETIEAAREIRHHWLHRPQCLDGASVATVQSYRRAMDCQQICTPDPKLDRLANHWLGYNLCFTAQWTRLYSRGFRDCMQDTQGVVTLDSSLARANLLEAMPHVYRSGRCRRAWAAGKGALLEQYYADQPTWVSPAFLTYLAETGDFEILNEMCPYFDGGEGRVWEHIFVCQKHLHEDRGTHGLCRIHEGDWCDSAHRLGIEGRGEGVWLSMAHHKSLMDFIEMAKHIGHTEHAELASQWAADIRQAINTHGWDGQWFSIAFNDEGRRIGTHHDTEGRIFLNPQSWSVISQCTSPERQRKSMAVVDEYLDSWVGPLLLTPPYTQTDKTIGSLTGFHPGTSENGSCYCHAASFKIVADCLLGRGEQAMKTFLAIMPGGTADQAAPIPTCPPFAFTNSRMAPFHPCDAGKHGATWITGTISWCFQALGQYILGVRPCLNGLKIDPCIPANWDFYRVRRYFRNAWYNIQVENPRNVSQGVSEIIYDGQRIHSGDCLPIESSGEHDVRVILG